jgi:hypothetical protein
MGAHLGVWAHSFTFSCILGSVNVTPKLHSQPAFFHAPHLNREPKVKVVTRIFYSLEYQLAPTSSPFRKEVDIVKH